MEADRILLTDWTWITPAWLLRRRPADLHVRVFGSRPAADRARRSYGRGRWRGMQIVRVGS